MPSRGRAAAQQRSFTIPGCKEFPNGPDLHHGGRKAAVARATRGGGDDARRNHAAPPPSEPLPPKTSIRPPSRCSWTAQPLSTVQRPTRPLLSYRPLSDRHQQHHPAPQTSPSTKILAYSTCSRMRCLRAPTVVKSVSSSVQKADALDSRDCGHSQAYFTAVAGLLYSRRSASITARGLPLSFMARDGCHDSAGPGSPHRTAGATLATGSENSPPALIPLRDRSRGQRPRREEMPQGNRLGRATGLALRATDALRCLSARRAASGTIGRPVTRHTLDSRTCPAAHGEAKPV